MLWRVVRRKGRGWKGWAKLLNRVVWRPGQGASQTSIDGKCVVVVYCSITSDSKPCSANNANLLSQGFYRSAAWVGLSVSSAVGLTGLKFWYRQAWTLICGLWGRIHFLTQVSWDWSPHFLAGPQWEFLSAHKGHIHSCNSTANPSHALNFSASYLSVTVLP